MKKINKKGQFTTEVFRTKVKWFWKGFNVTNWFVFCFGVALGFVLGVVSYLGRV